MFVTVSVLVPRPVLSDRQSHKSEECEVTVTMREGRKHTSAAQVCVIARSSAESK